MRSFSNVEQEIIKKMVEFQEGTVLNCLPNLIEKIAYKLIPDGFNLVLDCPTKGPGHAYFLVDKDFDKYSMRLEDAEQKAFNNISLVVLLFRYLEKNELIFLSKLNQSENIRKYSTGSYFQNDTANSYRFDAIEPKMIPDTIRFFSSRFFVSPQLEIYARNGFKTDLELIHIEQVKQLEHQNKNSTWVSYLSLAALIVTVVISLFDMFRITQVDLVGKNIEEVSTDLQDIKLALKQDSAERKKSKGVCSKTYFISNYGLDDAFYQNCKLQEQSKKENKLLNSEIP